MWKRFRIVIILLTFIVVAAIAYVNTESKRALSRNDSILKSGKVIYVTNREITIGTENFMVDKNVNERYPVDFSNLKAGDLVDYKVLSGDITDYLVEINKK